MCVRLCRSLAVISGVKIHNKIFNAEIDKQPPEDGSRNHCRKGTGMNYVVSQHSVKYSTNHILLQVRNEKSRHWTALRHFFVLCLKKL